MTLNRLCRACFPAFLSLVPVALALAGCGDGYSDLAQATADAQAADTAPGDGSFADGLGASDAVWDAWAAVDAADTAAITDATQQPTDTPPAEVAQDGGVDAGPGDDSAGAPDLAAETAAPGCKVDADCADDDANLCTGVPYCDLSGPSGVCKPNFKTVVECPPAANACQVMACVPATGKCEAKDAPAAKCDDGNPCTANDTCSGGQCKGGIEICKCLQDSDCADDGNLCNGTFYCDKSEFPFVCKVNPATVVTCPTGLDTECEKHVCNPAQGKCVVQQSPDGTACDDGDKCSAGDICVSGACNPGKSVCACTTNADCASHEDGDQCNGTLYCDLSLSAPACKINPATIVKCGSGSDTACAKNTCDPKLGKCQMVPLPDTATCSDDNLCTAGDHCASGKCKGGANTCACAIDADCAPHEDGNLCNGTLFCNKAAPPFVCDVNPATVVTCSDGLDTACSHATCDPKSGKCGMSAEPDGSLCDADDFACTKNDACLAGVCVPGTNVCTCVTGPDCDKHEDGNLCNGTLYCDKGTTPFLCKVNPATLVVCKSVDDTQCTKNLCTPATGKCGMTAINQGNVCEADGNLCTASDSCDAGVCVAGPNTCQCTADADCAAFDDGDLCNGTLFCDKSSLPFACKSNPATVVVCPSDGDTACVKNTCAKKTGLCAPTPLVDGTACSDGDVCTLGDACSKGACAGTAVCACKSDADCAAFDDTNLCNGGMFCDTQVLPHVCKPDNKPVTCPAASSPCLQSLCVPATGLCVGAADLSHDGTPCDDGDACTTASACAQGACLGAALLPCDDGKVCTADACAAGSCVHLALAGTACDDNDACTSGDKCSAAATCGGSPVACDDGNPCTDDSCAPVTGCQHMNNTAGCSDGDPCTAKDGCQGGKCAAVAKNCDDGNFCTADSCAANSGACVQAAVAVTPCDDGNLCTESDLCAQGVCTGKPKNCNDNNPCTTDACGVAGCFFSPVTVPTACDDGSACTTGDSCAAGKCQAGPSCNDNNDCTTDACVSGKCVFALQSGAKCNDGNACTDNDVCSGSGSCVGTPITCVACGSKTCDPLSGCPSQSGSCDDGNPCTIDGCTKDFGCTVEPTTPISCGADPKALCGQGICSTCTAMNAVIKIGGKNLVFAGLQHGAGGGVVAVGSTTKLSDGNVDAAIVLVGPTGNLDKLIEVGQAGVDSFAGVAAVGAQFWAVGWQTDTKASGQTDGLLVRFTASGGQSAPQLLGAGGDEALAAISDTPAGPVLVGAQAGKGWALRLSAAGATTDNAQQSPPLAGALAWNAVVPVGVDGSVLLAGSLDTGTATRGVVARLDKNLATVWMKVVGAGPGDNLAGLATDGGTYVAVGAQMATGSAAAWLVPVDVTSGPGTAQTDALAGLKVYRAATFTTDGSLVAVGGANVTGASGGPHWGWFARWTQKATSLTKSATVAAGTAQELFAVIPHSNHVLAAGTTKLPGSTEQQGWVVELGADGTPVCTP